MKKLMTVSIAAVLSMSVIACSKPAVAETAYTMPIDVSLGYGNNKILEKEGVAVAVGTEMSGVRFGVNALNSSDRMETYGAYVAAPIQIANTRVSVTPRAEVERYRVLGETLGSLGVGVEYQMASNTRAEVIYKHSKAFDSDVELDGDSYLVGFTQRF